MIAEEFRTAWIEAEYVVAGWWIETQKRKRQFGNQTIRFHSPRLD